mmetsp:Transcript_34943/g.92040  ORF Transcript_34943/g.92040 Transcript_34943/m.92040 type:complete len:204 (+) Transcript_34943:1-612(+)
MKKSRGSNNETISAFVELIRKYLKHVRSEVKRQVAEEKTSIFQALANQQPQKSLQSTTRRYVTLHQAIHGDFEPVVVHTLADSFDSAGLKAFVPPRNNIVSDYHIAIACRGLPRKEGYETDPLCLALHRRGGDSFGDEWTELFRTERARDATGPRFKRRMVVRGVRNAEQAEQLRLRIFVVDDPSVFSDGEGPACSTTVLTSK